MMICHLKGCFAVARAASAFVARILSVLPFNSHVFRSLQRNTSKICAPP
jgi:hypothetical protein